ncbi:alkylation response protein AidB-like acyl-CoA dehydrogenase [Streptomyces sp. LBL]|uniref:acyl-CoA dehydrogenase family protein n=1 Tax=Streptomyces sp. LBL TaxID=2940562 RepID=UPI002475F9DC|nr:acyl-CoA dehydrogenase family protein [Streptomyces sp. LBL]MDH6627010.1 alkylation response protein AidB-like acyl-CoA dehydrogenase [Streptomyces sp. LBL]
MRFLLDPEQRAFADSLDAMLTAADTPSVVRDWSRGDHAGGRALWSRIAEAGVFALAVPEAYEGMGPRPVELAVAFVELGRHAVPGPLVETVTAATLLAALDDTGPAGRLLPALASGASTATLARGPYALDADVADVRLTVSAPRSPAEPTGTTYTTYTTEPNDATDTTDTTKPTEPTEPTDTAKPIEPTEPTDVTELRLAPPPGPPRSSLDPARRLFPVPPGGELLATGPHVAAAAARALTTARLAVAAQALGVGRALLDTTVTHVKQRTQFGVPIGSFQAVKHRLADAELALEFARPLVFGAALTMTARDAAAAKVTACEAAYATARTALQLHGAIGYTAEYDLSLWLTRARALRTAWGSPDECRAAVLTGGGRHW